MNIVGNIALEIKKELKKYLGHIFISLTSRGNSAIEAALSLLPRESTIIIPEEGGWLSYKSAPQKLGLNVEEVCCDKARISLEDLRQKFSKKQYSALLYQNPGGYHAKQPMKEIYEWCCKHQCIVILDGSGSIGTERCDGRFADIIVGSFGRWKPVDAGKGGFISCKDEKLFEKLRIKEFTDEETLKIICAKLQQLPKRLEFLQEKRQKIMKDLDHFKIINEKEEGLVILVSFTTDNEKEKIIDFCQKNKLEWTECPRYIRLNEKAISIEVKRSSS